MNESYLEITYRHGRPIAAYYYLPRRPGQKSHRTTRVEHGLIIDFSRSGKPIGIEITSPGEISLSVINRVLEELGQSKLKRADIAPLLAA